MHKLQSIISGACTIVFSKKDNFLKELLCVLAIPIITSCYFSLLKPGN